MYQILALSSLCTITRYQNERFRHHFTKNFSLLRIRCSDNCSNIAVGISHTFASPLCYLFTNQFIQRTTVDQTILELSAGWIGGLYENKDSFLFFFAYIHKRLDTIGSQIWIYCSKILIKTGICFACDLYFSEMSGRIGCGCGTDIPTLYISDHNQIFLVAVIYRLLECRYTGHTKLLIHRDLRLHCRNQVVCCINNSFIVLPDGFCCSL